MSFQRLALQTIAMALHTCTRLAIQTLQWYVSLKQTMLVFGSCIEKYRTARLYNSHHILAGNLKIETFVQVNEPYHPGPIAMVVDCPDESYIDSLVADPSWRPFYGDETQNSEGDKKVDVVIHLARSKVRTLTSLLHYPGPLYRNFSFPKSSARNIGFDHRSSLALKAFGVPTWRFTLKKFPLSRNYMEPKTEWKFPISIHFITNESAAGNKGLWMKLQDNIFNYVAAYVMTL